MIRKLQQLLENETNPEERLTLLLKQVEAYTKRGKIPEAYQSLEEAEALADNDTLKARCLIQRSSLLMGIDRNKDALPVLLELQQKIEQGSCETDIALLYNQFGICYRGMGDFDNCLKYYNLSYDAFAERNDLEGMTGTMINIGNVYNSFGRLETALEHFQKAEELIGDQEGFEEHKLLISSGMAAIYRKKKQLDLALAYNEKALSYCYQLEDTRGVCNALNSMALLRKDQDRLDDALELYQSCLQISESKGFESLIATALANIGQIYMLKDEYEEAKKYVERGLEVAQKIEASHLIMQIYFMHARLYAGMGEIERTFEFFIKYDRAKSEFLNNKAVERLHNLEMKFDLERKQHEAEMYRLRNEELEAKNKQLKEAQEEIRELERRNSINAMAVTANHELNQPLMVIQGNLDMLESDIESAGEKAMYRLKKIRASLERINEQLAKFRRFEDAHVGEYSAKTPMILFEDND